MKKLNLIRKIIKFPFALLFFPLLVIIGFFFTDWENGFDRKFYKELLKNLLF